MSAPATCSKAALATWCNDKDVKRVQLRSQATGPTGPNKFEGAVVNMCSECRKANRGGLKFAPDKELS